MLVFNQKYGNVYGIDIIWFCIELVISDIVYLIEHQVSSTRIMGTL